MKKRWILTLVLTCLFFVPKLAFAVDFDITSYNGELTINKDNTAVFRETITYHFKSDYHGQSIGLGKAGKMPSGFEINSKPEVLVSRNGKVVQEPLYYMDKEEDGYKVLVYNQGNSGDTVRVTVTWQLTNLLFLYKDIAELNWQPLTDSSADIDNFDFSVTSATEAGALYFHTGQLFDQGNVKESNGIYHIKMKHLPRQKAVELHAYWPRADFSQAPDQGLNEERLQEFKTTEAHLASGKFYSKLLMQWLFPIGLSCLLIACLIFYRLFYNATKIKKEFEKNHRLYEPPMDLPPMVLAEAIYSTSLEEISPTTKGFGRFTFDQLVQATLLDLVDRGNLAIIQDGEVPHLRVISEKGLANFEKEFLKMTLSGEKEIAISDLFSDYEISAKIFAGASKTTEKAIQSKGNAIKYSFETRLQKMQDCVRDKVLALRIPNYYRPLTKMERHLVFGMLANAVGSCIGAFLLFYQALKTNGYFSIFLLLIGLIGLALSIRVYFVTRGPSRDGVVTEEGAEALYLWTSFENMLRDIAHLDEAELESLAVWNRLLVYATLYGYAKKVSKVMKLRKIKLENQSLDLYLACGWHHQFHTSATQINHYTSIATKASHYSVSSGSGSSGGGFSGGGGGGSVGAF